MKIYKIHLDPSNPIEKLVKVPVGSDYGLQIIWDNEKYPTFTDSNVATYGGYLVSENGTATEMSSEISPLKGQRTFLSQDNVSLPKVNNIGDTIVWVYNPTNTTDKTASTFGSIKVLGVDADDFEIDLGSSGGSSFNYITEDSACGCIMIGNGARDVSLIASNILTLCSGNVEVSANKHIRLNGNSVAIGSSSDPATVTINGTNIYDIASGGGSSFDYILEDSACGCIMIGCGASYVSLIASNILTLCGDSIYINGTQICMTKFLADYGM